MAQLAEKAPLMLNSWKEIAAFLNRGVRTVQRWERDLELPVHRIGKGTHSPVYALIPELKFWIATSSIKSTPQGRALEQAMLPRPGKNGGTGTPLEISHRLMSESLTLVRTLADTSVRQQQHTKALQKRILEMKARMK